MTMSARSVAAGILALVSTAAPSTLAAQGGQRVARSAQVSVAQSAEAKLAPARGMLRTLAGTWCFDMRFAGNFDGPADVSGARLFTPLFDSLRLELTEALDHSPVQGQGVDGFYGRSGRLFRSGVYRR